MSFTLVGFLAALLTIYLWQRMDLPTEDILNNTSGNRVGNVPLQLKALRRLTACFINTAHEDAPMVKEIPTEYQLIRCSRECTLPMRLISFPVYSTCKWETIIGIHLTEQSPPVIDTGTTLSSDRHPRAYIDNHISLPKPFSGLLTEVKEEPCANTPLL
ncbi:uncharacterized protein BO87DRAFT_187372 [Aspergillus neoniger CBS 115656]|uniref:Uncharacterized protein n=1 Tax=Aspergillus neoniger (strain CBS 115656) TaxID=1448310 RepID=A0A318YT43_ASPNB|nr:hypothetical protein BO87DRAFT_187372 [Aspergillus neoniger CBS 115656]PYH37841.1 hypothetical protein BO87DRAFT_187372 [Aspergillus neoniger CBS 115656]